MSKKRKNNRNIKIIIATFSILIFLLILKDVCTYEITYYDDVAYNVFVESMRNDTVTFIMKLITSFGSLIVLLSILFVMLLHYKDKKDTVLASVNVLVVFLINSLLKFLVGRPRPSGYNLIDESNYSFPSGHSMISTAFYGFLIYLVYKNVKDKRKKYILISLLFLLIILICISRIYLGVHYLSDTLGGFFFSMAYLMLFVSLIPIIDKGKVKRNGKKKKKS
jgi:undecaprenyl-diphosphatase